MSKGAATEVYKIYLNHVRGNEGRVLQLLAIVLSAFGGLALVYKEFPTDKDMLRIASFGATALLVFGIFYSLSLGYIHRYLQIAMWKYKKKLSLQDLPQWDPKSFRKWSIVEVVLLDIAPEFYKLNLIGFGIGIAFVWYVFWLRCGAKPETVEALSMSAWLGVKIYLAIAVVLWIYGVKLKKRAGEKHPFISFFYLENIESYFK